MNDRDRFIAISADKIQLTPEFAVPWSATNLPWQHFRIRPHQEYLWKIRIISFDKKAKQLNIQVIDYHHSNQSNFANQKMNHPVDQIAFTPLEWSHFEAFLSYFKKDELLPFIVDHDVPQSDQLTEEQFKYKIRAAFNDVKFKLGYVSLWTKLPALNHEVELKIHNPHILPQFDFIKNYFSRVLKAKKFDIDVEVTMLGENIKELRSKAKKIAAIDDDFVRTMKHTKIIGLKKNPSVVLVDKQLFSSDEIFDQYEDDLSGNIFKQNPSDILATLTELGLVRNRKQLEFLAGRKQDEDQGILISLSPHFGFLFCITGQKMRHFIWELVDSHATYIWSFDKNKKDKNQQLKKIEELIGMIREQGREKYKKFYQEETDPSSYLFRTIIHDPSTGMVDPFPRWRYRLEEMLE